MKTMISGIKPTGKMTLGNYLGAIKHWAKMQEAYHMFIFIANLHAITLPIEKEDLKTHSRQMAALLLACGINPENTTLFLQSDVKEHAELGYILACETYMGELSRMHQYKDYVEKKADKNIPTGVFIYPALMAADILLYDCDLVPVGADQKQHVEIARDIAIRLNNRYSEKVFQVPEPFTPPVAQRVMSLSDPFKKMAKSDQAGDKGCIYLLDEPAIIKKKINAAVTDLDGKIKFNPIDKPGVSNLMSIYSSITGLSLEKIEELFQDKLYGYFKSDLAEKIIAELAPIQERYKKYINDDEYLHNVLAKGANKARIEAEKKLNKIKDLLGINVF